MKKSKTTKIMKTKLLILSFAFCAVANAQAPSYLWAKSAGGTSYDYGNSCSTDANGNIIATGFFYSPTITFGTTTLTNADNTGNIADMFIVKLNGVSGIEESAFGGENVSVYPNPSTGMFSIVAPSLKGEKSSIEIYNVLGEKVFQSIINNQSSIINLENQPNGIYFLSIKTEQGIVNKKIIIQ